MGNDNSHSRGSIRPRVVRPYSMPAPIRDTICSSYHEDYVVLDEKPVQENGILSKAIAIEPSTQSLYFVDESSHSVRVMSPDFSQMFRFSGGKHPMHYPWGLCIKLNKVYVTEHYSSLVSVFTLNGERITRCSYRLTKNPKQNLGFLTGLAVDDTGNIYICDLSNHKIIILTHDLEGFTEFGRSTLQQPRDIKISGESLIILDSLQGMKKTIYADDWVLRIYSLKEELLKVIRLETKNVYFFDITKDSNFVISGSTQIKLISKRGIKLKTFENGILDTRTTYQPGIVVDMQTNELIVMSNVEFGKIAFIKFLINEYV